jgi:hypothetical protein
VSASESRRVRGVFPSQAMCRGACRQCVHVWRLDAIFDLSFRDPGASATLNGAGCWAATVFEHTPPAQLLSTQLS